MKRYAICDIIGTGTELDPYRPAIENVGERNYVSLIPTENDPQSPNYGKPKGTKCLVRLATNNVARLVGATGVDLLPDFALDAKVSAMHTPTRVLMRAMLQRRGLNPGWLDNADGFRDVVRNIGQALEPAFDENFFDVAE
jgi:hypothetical protein